MSVAVPELDEDHKQLIAITNELYDGIVEGLAQDRLEAILEVLVRYTQSHFSHEEALFTQCPYPDKEKHIREHREMMAWAGEAQQRFHAGANAQTTFELLDALKNWLFRHIGGSDRRMAPYLRHAGLGQSPEVLAASAPGAKG